MMQKLRLCFYLVMVAILATSCVSTEPQLPEPKVQEGYYGGLFEPWNENIKFKSSAVSSLLKQADSLIGQKKYRMAEGKLERLLSISPGFAPAWSRMSWLALQMEMPKRAKQMASRSNSFASSNTPLKILNWSFIRDASIQMDDQAGAQQASRTIESMSAKE